MYIFMCVYVCMYVSVFVCTVDYFMNYMYSTDFKTYKSAEILPHDV